LPCLPLLLLLCIDFGSNLPLHISLSLFVTPLLCACVLCTTAPALTLSLIAIPCLILRLLGLLISTSWHIIMIGTIDRHTIGIGKLVERIFRGDVKLSIGSFGCSDDRALFP
jgi:hypothetical protein